METSLLAALAGAQIGRIQLAVAARLARLGTDNAASITKLVDAAQQSGDRLANAAIGIGTNLN